MPIALLLLMTLSISGVFGQSSTAKPVFEVASVKPANPNSRQLRVTISPGHLTAGSVSLRALIEEAYQLKPFQLSGGPRWMDADKFEVTAQAPESASDSQIRLMLQSLLAERFQLTLQSATKEQTYSVLTVKGKPKLEPSKEDGRYSMATSTSGRGAESNPVKFTNTSMAKLADILSRELNHLVVDQTGLSGEFDFQLEATRDPSEPNPFVVPLAPAISDVGLKLESKKGPIEFFVVDRAERPSAN